MLSVAVITVPEAVPVVTRSTTGKFATAPEATVVAVHVTVPVPPTAGLVQAHPAGVASERNVVLAGIASVKTALAALVGPLLVTTPVIVKLVFGITVGVDAVFVTCKSADVEIPTVVIAVAELFVRFGSVVPEVMLSTSTICVPLIVPAPTVTLRVKLEGVEAVKLGLEHEIVPLLPDAGVEQIQPAAGVKD
jgi:hypothetical protein